MRTITIALVLVLAATLFIASSYAGHAVDFCTTRRGNVCNKDYDGAVSASATVLSSNTLTVTLDNEQGTVEAVEESDEEQESESAATLTAPAARNYQCSSSCEWLRTAQYFCDSCNYPWALYDRKNGYYGNCITQDTVWKLTRETPARVDEIVQMCSKRGQCKCAQPKQGCKVQCSWFLGQELKNSKAGKIVLYLGLKTNEMGMCPTNEGEVWKLHNEQQEAMRSLCKYYASKK